VGQAQANTKNGAVDVTAYVVRWQGTMNYIFLWVTPANASRQSQPPIASSVQSLRSISMQAANPPPAMRVDVVTVQRGDTPASISRTMAFDQYKEERFRVMNAIGPAEGLRAGERVKLVR
jgi:predicted Zn-dependent protease